MQCTPRSGTSAQRHEDYTSEKKLQHKVLSPCESLTVDANRLCGNSMGKIQAAIKRLNNKVRPTAAVTETLRIPAQQEHESSPLPTDPAGIKT